MLFHRRQICKCRLSENVEVAKISRMTQTDRNAYLPDLTFCNLSLLKHYLPLNLAIYKRILCDKQLVSTKKSYL